MGAGGVGACEIGSCDRGWGNCDGADVNGCENPLNTLTACGGCPGYADPEGRTGSSGAFPTCARANVGESCAEVLGEEGTEKCRTSGTCDAGFGNCDLPNQLEGSRASDMNGCENTLDSLSSCGACGAVCNLANGSDTCSGDVCRIAMCNSTYFDVNGTTGLSADGCECQDMSTNTTCAAATPVTAVARGSLVSKTGLIPFGTTTDYDWYVVSFGASGRMFSGDYAGVGSPRVVFTAGGDEYAFDVFYNSCASLTASSCGGGGTHLNLLSWSFNDGNDSGAGISGYRTEDVAWPSTIYLRVHRRSAVATCNTYTIEASR